MKLHYKVTFLKMQRQLFQKNTEREDKGQQNVSLNKSHISFFNLFIAVKQKMWKLKKKLGIRWEIKQSNQCHSYTVSHSITSSGVRYTYNLHCVCILHTGCLNLVLRRLDEMDSPFRKEYLVVFVKKKSSFISQLFWILIWNFESVTLMYQNRKATANTYWFYLIFILESWFKWSL